MKKLRTGLKYKWLVVFLLIWILIYKFINKNDLIDIIQRSLPRQEAALLAGMVWGEKGGMSNDFYILLKNTGLIHMVVVSGANLMIVGKNLIENLAKLVSRKIAIVFGGGVILLYVNLVGWQIPVVRALTFLGIYYWAQVIGRPFIMGRALLVVALIMFLADFKIITNVSFWLSMAAFVAVILSQKEGIFKNTIWVSLFVLPILSITFGQISLITPITNLGVLFLVEILTIVGFLGSLAGLLWEALGRVVLMICYPFLRYIIEVVEGIGKIGGVISFEFNWWMFLGWYLMIGGYWYEKKKT
jgi:competence protein ComEC